MASGFSGGCPVQRDAVRVKTPATKDRAMTRSRLFALIAVLALAASPLAQAEHDYSNGYDDRSRSYEDPYQGGGYQTTTSRYGDSYQSDQALHDEVHDALEQALGGESRGIRVDVRGGHVYLSGAVRSSRARSIAHDVAHDVPGVHGVYTNRLYQARRYPGRWRY